MSPINEGRARQLYADAPKGSISLEVSLNWLVKVVLFILTVLINKEV